MHHSTLDRPGTHDGNLDNEVVKIFRPEAREHAHLRAALDLKDAERVAPLDHVESGFAVGWKETREIAVFAIMVLEQIQALANASEYAAGGLIEGSSCFHLSQTGLSCDFAGSSAKIEPMPNPQSTKARSTR